MAPKKNNIPAKLCFEHIGGKLGELLKIAFEEKGWIDHEKAGEKQYYITEAGIEGFTKLGIDLTQIKTKMI